MKLPSYPTYKDSGVEWLGVVPSHWTVWRLGALFREVAEEGIEGLPILSVSIHDGVSDRELGDEELDRKVTRSDDVTKYRRVEPGDLVYNMMRAWQGGFGTVTVAGMVSPAYVVARPTTALATSFVENLLRTSMAVEEMRRLSKGVTDFRLRLYWDEFKTLKIAVPPEAEQRVIAAFLDRETAKIDALIGEQERLIELLAEKRRAVISHAVTKGLDPNAPMKDSGIAWLGEVPAHWVVSKLKWHIDVLSGFAFPSTGFSGDEESIRLLRGINVGIGRIRWDDVAYWERAEDDGLDRFSLTEGQLVMGMDRPWIEGGARVAILGCDDVPCLLLQRVAALTPKDDLARDFIYAIMHSSDFKNHFITDMTGVSVPHISPDQICSFPFAVPPLDEQKKIIVSLANKTSRLDALVAEAERAIALLKERRAALISAAVTGKIDVRGAFEEAA
ncbi:restriction endonuclease subunit S [Blastochloris tepida]|uniref:Restriction modification system DNA specificity domain-containing protein n=1 Tax=Blastochloris tepida TaxID=2233851 RepID=A0A348G1I0_9HYPH|nr:restriction endonuclease subunit S [Blastochloris tepida]BBF93413.1 restriction modification system DNA specificity domain-containing protein [Blastochloris tepida]